MNNNVEDYNRHSIRLKGYDYSVNGLYFVTICTNENNCLFGEIQDGQMYLNDSGKMIYQIYNDLNKLSDALVCLDVMVMPNHFHCIWQILDSDKISLSDIVRSFKSLTTHQYIKGVKENGWQPFNGKLWQRNYYEHIIRDSTEFDHIKTYINSNPERWYDDVYHSSNTYGE